MQRKRSFLKTQVERRFVKEIWWVDSHIIFLGASARLFAVLGAEGLGGVDHVGQRGLGLLPLAGL